MSSVGIVRFTLIIFTTNDNVKTMKCDVLQFFSNISKVKHIVLSLMQLILAMSKELYLDLVFLQGKHLVSENIKRRK